MSLWNVIAIAALVAGILYVILAIVASYHSHARKASGAGDGRVLFEFEESVDFAHGEPIQKRMRKIATICARAAHRAFAQSLDFTPESVAKLDRLIVAGWGSPARNATAEVDRSVILTFGAYLGEVLVRRTRGRWVTGIADADPANILFVSDGNRTASVSPFLLIEEKFRNMYTFDLSIAFTALDQKLKELDVA